MTPEQITQRQQITHRLLREAGILPVVTVTDIPGAISVAHALVRGGLTAIELTLRSAVALEAICAVKQEVPQLVMGVGTVLSVEQANAASAAGADFLVTPGTPAPLAAALAAMPTPTVPGAATATEIMALMALGFDAIKLFPAASAGGIGIVKSLAGPLPQLRICPTGGITEANAEEYLRQPNIIAVGGSWMVSPQWIANRQFDLVEQSARRCRVLIDAARA
jgi:2-dehydro-3-deoxyphosphogluconate aldolase / (4S)-4-hydroxy-2-oxoglutarate aldolase